MKRALKILGIIVGAVAGLILLAVVALPFVVDPNDYRGDIERLVESRTGRKLTMEGPIELSVFPWLGAKIGKVTLGNAAGFGPEPFARVDSADVRVRVLPLLWGEVEIGRVVLHGARVHLARAADGRTNWADLTAPAAGEAAPPPEGGEPEAAGGGALAALTVGGLSVRDAEVSWSDAVSGAKYRVSGLDLTAGAVRAGQAFPLALSLKVDSNQPQLAGDLRLSGQATLDPAAGRYRLAGAELETDLQGPVLPTGRLRAQLATELAADLEAGTASAKGLDLRAYGARVQGETTLAGLAGTPSVDGRLTLTAADGKALARLAGSLAPGLTWAPKALADTRLETHFQGGLGAKGMRVDKLEGALLGLQLDGSAEVALPDSGAVASADLKARVADARRLLAPLGEVLPAGMKAAALDGAELATRARLDAGAGRLQVPALRLAALGLSARASADARDLFAAPAASGKLSVAPFSPRKLAGKLGIELPETADKKVLERAGLDTAFTVSPRGAGLSGLTLTLDDARLTGSAGVPDFAGPKVRFDLALNGIDADRYLPPAAEGETPASPGGAAGAGGGGDQLPMERLRRLDVAGSLNVGKLKVSGVRLSDLRLRLDGRGGQLRLHPLSARLYGGGYSGDVRLDARGDTPRVDLNEHLSGVAVGPLMEDAIGKAYFTGSGDVTADLTFRGAETGAMLRSLNGRGSYTLRDGTVAGVDLGRALSAAAAALGKGNGPSGKADGTAFRELKGTAVVKDGRVHSDDLSLRSSALDVAGKGFVDLPEARVDYGLSADIREGAGVRELQGLTVPIRIEGPVAGPRVKVDLAQAIKERAQQQLKKQQEKTEKQIEQKLEEKKKDLRKELQDKAKDLLKF
ncbi:MAG TPA: AsmA family protein [Gammaproteobacteria bacterium]|nr:AsmA family protein [Gammaproteobacteria bacterium]